MKVVLLSYTANYSFNSAVCTMWLHILAWQSKIMKPVKIATTVATSVPHTFEYTRLSIDVYVL